MALGQLMCNILGYKLAGEVRPGAQVCRSDRELPPEAAAMSVRMPAPVFVHICAWMGLGLGCWGKCHRAAAELSFPTCIV